MVTAIRSKQSPNQESQPSTCEGYEQHTKQGAFGWRSAFSAAVELENNTWALGPADEEHVGTMKSLVMSLVGTGDHVGTAAPARSGQTRVGKDSSLTTAAYTLNELMVAAAAREIRDHEIVFVGMRLPLIAFVVAKRTHAPNAIGLFENGVIRSTPARELIYTMADPPNLLGATQCLDMMGVMSLLQSGRVNLGFLVEDEVDRFGKLNSTRVR